MDRLTPLLARDAEHRGLVDVRVELQRGFDLGRVDVHAARDDHVLLSITDEEVALVIAVGDIAHGLPALPVVGEEAIVLLVVVVEDRRAADEELARVVRPRPGDLPAVVVEQANLDQRRRLPARSRLPQLVLRLEDAVHAQLGGSVHLPQRVGRKVGQIEVLEREGPGGGVGDHALHGRSVVAALHLIRQRADHADGRGRREGGRHAVAVDQAQPVLRIEAALDDDLLAESERDGHERPRARVVERPGGDVDVVRGVPDQLDHPLHLDGVARPAAVGPFRLAGGARGVDHRRPGSGAGGQLGFLGRGRGHQLAGVGHARRCRTVIGEDGPNLGDALPEAARTSARSRRRHRPRWRRSDRPRRRPRRRPAGS